LVLFFYVIFFCKGNLMQITFTRNSLIVLNIWTFWCVVVIYKIKTTVKYNKMNQKMNNWVHKSKKRNLNISNVNK
jgi:hypothetical protein